jgi:hypothetical protein
MIQDMSLACSELLHITLLPPASSLSITFLLDVRGPSTFFETEMAVGRLIQLPVEALLAFMNWCTEAIERTKASLRSDSISRWVAVNLRYLYMAKIYCFKRV